MKLDKITRSPNEEWQARCARDGAPEPLPDQIRSQFFLQPRKHQLTPEGFCFTLRKVAYRFHHPEMLVLSSEQNLGKVFDLRYDPDDMACVHVLTSTGKYIETVPRYIAPAMLDEAAAAEAIHAKRAQVKRLAAELQFLHQDDTNAAAREVIHNRDRMQRVRTFPVPGRDNNSTADRTPAAASSEVDEGTHHTSRVASPGRPIVDAATNEEPSRFDLEEVPADSREPLQFSRETQPATTAHRMAAGAERAREYVSRANRVASEHLETQNQAKDKRRLSLADLEEARERLMNKET